MHAPFSKKPVPLAASAIVILLLCAAAAFPREAAERLIAARAFALGTFGWFYLLVVGGLVAATLMLALGRFGDVRLGPDGCEPDYPYPAWLAMLIIAGLGIGLLYYAAAEPVLFYARPLTAAPGSVEAARQAMPLVFFHWGLHAWAIYAVIGLSLAYFSHRLGLPLAVRSGLYPLIGERIHGPIGDVTDIIAISGTLFGIATTLGLGVLQINAGLHHLLGVPETVTVQLILAAMLTAAAMLVIAGRFDQVIRRLSQVNLALALVLLAFVVVAGPTEFLFNAFIQNIGAYLGSFVERTFGAYAYEPQDRLKDWTLYYWAGWIGWSPFVGVFIAQISRGRTVREFLVGLMLIPTLFTCFWITAFGNTAISMDLGAAEGALAREVEGNYASAVFQVFGYLPWSSITAALAVLLVALIFITTTHSGAMVVDTIATGGTSETPTRQRLYWCGLQGVIIVALLPTGGFDVLYGLTGVGALLFALILLLLVLGLLTGLRADLAKSRSEGPSRSASSKLGLPDWRTRLGAILRQPSHEDVRTFIEHTAGPALDEVCRELVGRGLGATTDRDEDGGVRLTVRTGATGEFVYRVAPTHRPAMAFSPSEAASPEGRRAHVWRARSILSDGANGRDVLELDQDALITDVLEHFEHHQAA